MLVALILALAGLAFAPGAASAGTVSLNGQELRWVAGFSETNTVTITKGGFLQPYVVEDTTAALSVGQGCTSKGTGKAECGGLDVISSIYADAGALADTVTVNSDAPATIRGGTNADTLRGGSGNDMIYGEFGSSDDVDGRGDTIYGNDGNDTLHGGSTQPGARDELFGGAGNDTIYGDFGPACPSCLYAGPDSLDGGPNDDTLRGEAGDDVLKDGGTHWDDLAGGDGTDTADYSAHSGRVEIDLRLFDNQGEAGENDKIATIENVTGGSAADALIGTDNANTLKGNGGNDALTGLNGVDRFEGDGGDDSISARDNNAEDVVCGSGTSDSATADSADRPDGCESVDAPPAISIADTRVVEGGSATFTISLDRPTGTTVTVRWDTAPGSASAGADYTTSGGTATIAANTLSTTVSVPTAADTLDEDDENFEVNLSNASANVDRIADSRAVGTIEDNDPLVAVSMGSDVSVQEGNSQSDDKTARFVLSLDRPSGRPVSVEYATDAGSASLSYFSCTDWGEGILDCGYPPGGDARAPHQGDCVPAPYDTCVANGGRIDFAPGQTQAAIDVPINEDQADEPDEAFTVRLLNPGNATIGDAQAVGTILDDDPTPAVSISNASVNEGDPGVGSAPQAVLTISLNRATSAPVSLSFATADGSATSPGDYAQHSGTVDLAPLQTSAQVAVPIERDLADETDESFTVNLSTASTAVTLSDDSGQVTIVDDDERPEGATLEAIEVGESAATLTGTVNPQGIPASYWFEYGPTTAYGSQTPAATAGSSALTQNVSAALSGLAPGTTYHYRIVATNASGRAEGADRTFTTAPRPPDDQSGIDDGSVSPGQDAGSGSPTGGDPSGQSGAGIGGQQQQQNESGAASQDQTAPAFTLARGKLRLRDLLKKGLRARGTCSEACTVQALLQIDAKTARKLKLGRKAYSVGTGRGVAQRSGDLVVSVNATRKAKKALKRLKSLRATLTLVATDSAGNSSTPVRRRVTLKR